MEDYKMEITTITLSKGNKEELEKLKSHPRQSMNDIIHILLRRNRLYLENKKEVQK